MVPVPKSTTVPDTRGIKRTSVLKACRAARRTKKHRTKGRVDIQQLSHTFKIEL
jgi:hypothetical protein